MLLYIFGNSDYLEYFSFDGNIEDIIFENLEKFSKKINDISLEYNRTRINTIASDISYFTNSKMLDFWYKKFPEVFECNYTYNYVYNMGYDNVLENNYNLLLAAFDNNNFENVLYLVKNHKFNFWNKIYGKKIQNIHIETIEDILEICPISHNTEHIKIIVSLIEKSEFKVQITLYNHFLDLKVQDDMFIKKIILNCIVNNNIKFIDYIIHDHKFPAYFS